MGGVASVLAKAAGSVWGVAVEATRNSQLFTALAIPLVLGSITGFATLPQVFTWYQKLNKPWWCPPSPVFGQTWGVLYGIMGYASYLVWSATGWPSYPLAVYGVQLVMNLAWQVIFFLAHRPDIAQVENAVLLGATAYTAHLFYQVDPLAGKLMIPYVAWTAFANALNFAILKRNPYIPDSKGSGLKPKAA